jgi:hypothetical protein
LPFFSVQQLNDENPLAGKLAIFKPDTFAERLLLLESRLREGRSPLFCETSPIGGNRHTRRSEE